MYIHMKYIVTLFSFVLFLIFSNIANSNNLFESDFIKVEIKTSNAYETKSKSIEEVKIKSLFIIIR